MLYLHIGTPKTGTSSIQKFLRDHDLPHRYLRSTGQKTAWKLAISSETESARARFVRRRDFERREGIAAGDDFDRVVSNMWGDLAAEVAANPERDFIASSECIWTDFEHDEDAMERLRDRLVALFGTVGIIVYFRDQPSFVKSYYGQMVKGKLRLTDSFAEAVNDRATMADWCDYAARLKHWSRVFGADAITAVPFHRANFIGGNLIADFLHRTGMAQPALLAQSEIRRRSNSSPTYFQIDLLRRANRFGIRTQAPFVNRLTRMIGPKDFPSRFDGRILAAAGDGNALLNAEYFADFPVKLPTEAVS